MMTFNDFLNEQDNTKIIIKKATVSDRKKGEVYVVYDESNNTIVEYDGKLMHMLKRESAKAVAATNSKWKVASASWAHDKNIT